MTAIGIVLLVGTTGAMALLNVGFVAQFLPLRTLGWVLYTHRYLLPGCLLFALQAAMEANDRSLFRVTVTLLLIAAGIDALFTTTRAALVFLAVRLVGLVAVTGRLNRSTFRPALAALVLAIVAFPFISQVRGGEIEGKSLGAALQEARAQPQESEQTLWDKYLDPVIERFVGINSLLPILQSEARVPFGTAIGSFWGQGGITDFNTRVIWGYPQDEQIGIAPSVLGWFYLAGGPWLEPLGLAILLAFLILAWRAIDKSQLRSRAVVQALLLGFLFTYFSDGVLDDIGLPAAAIAGTAAFIEVILRPADKRLASRRMLPGLGKDAAVSHQAP